MTKQIARNTFFLTLATVGQKTIAFVYYLFLARIMMPEQTGNYFLALSFSLLFGVLADFGLTSVLIREIAKHESEAMTLVRQAWGLKCIVLVLGIAVALLFIFFFPYTAVLKFLILFAITIMVADSLSVFFYGILRGFQIIRYESFGIFAGQCLSAVLGGLVLWLYPSLFLLLVALFCGSLWNTCFGLYHVVKRLGGRILIPLWDRQQMKRLFLTALPFALAAFFVKISSYLDSVLLSFYLGTAVVGIYSVAYKFTYAFQFFPLSFVAALYPGMSALQKNIPDQVAPLFFHSLRYVLGIGVPITFGIWAIAPDMVALTGEDYVLAVPILRMLIFVLIPIFLDFPIGSFLNAAGKQSTKTLLMGITMVLNIVLNLFSIPLWGMMGAVSAALISFSFLAVSGLFVASRWMKGFSWSVFFHLFVPILGSGAIMGLAVFVLRPLIGFLPVVFCGVIFYGALLLLLRVISWTQLKQTLYA